MTKGTGLSSKEPWQLYPSIWKNETAFFTYLRGQLRLIWSRYPPKLDFKKAQMVAPPAGYTGRAKKLGKCHYCGEFHAASNLEVDHVHQAGKCNSWQTAYEFLHKLLDANGNWVLACKPCHKVKSYAERMNISFEKAWAAKRAIEFLKNEKKKVVDFCVAHGYNVSSLNTVAKRREAVEAIYLKEILSD